MDAPAAQATRPGRRRLGAFYTPPELAASLAAATLGPLIDAGRAPESIRVCDPSVGAGALLSAAVSYLVSRGATRQVATANMTGVDLDPDAVSSARRALGRGATLLVGDALSVSWESFGDGQRLPFDAVLANPPFLGQLKRDTARSRATAAGVSVRFGTAAGGYVDSAALFLMLSIELAERVGIILPASLLATVGSAEARRRVGGVTRLERSWSPPLGTFDAGVRTVVLVLARAAPSGPWAEGRWGSAAGGGAPAVTLRSAGVLGDVVAATADFRDQFYGAVDVASDSTEGPPLVTCGLIDPAWSRWGSTPARLGGRDFAHPRAEVGRLDARLQRWSAARLVPKVLLATQTRVLEAIADEDGSLLPVVPVISVACTQRRVWHVLAVLLAPPVSARARLVHGGSALSADAIKLSARQVAEIPLPADRTAWNAGARAARRATLAGRDGDEAGWRAALDGLGRVMCDAYGVDDGAVMSWWSAQIDRRTTKLRSGSCS